MKNTEPINGILLLDKPSGLSSHDAVQKVRKILGQPSVGHTGTLDPLAEGLLPLCLGRFTKLSGYIQDERKSYHAELHLGMTSISGDAEGLNSHQTPRPVPELTLNEREEILSRFRGVLDQQVPRYSAVRIDGKRLYDLARQAERAPELPESELLSEPPIRKITIFALEVLSYSEPLLRLEIDCSKGTYIRSLARDLGEAFGCGAYVSALRRTSVGNLTIDKAVTFEGLRHAIVTGTVKDHLVSPATILPFPSVIVSDSFVPNIGYGRMPTSQNIDRVDREIYSGEIVMLRDPSGNLLALARSGQHWSQRGLEGPLPMSFERVLV